MAPLTMAPIRTFSGVLSGSTVIPLQLSGSCHADFAIRNYVSGDVEVFGAGGFSADFPFPGQSW